MRPRHVLVVAWWFPPLAGGGVHRPLQFARHLVRRGLRVSVLTGVPPHAARRDEGLLARVPSDVRVVRVPLVDPLAIWAKFKGTASRPPRPPAAKNGAPTKPSWRELLSAAIKLPDSWLPWVVPATARGALAWRGDEPDLVFSTSPPHSVHLVAAALAGLFSCPLVLDFRDPWMGNPFREYASPLHRRIDAALEQRAVDAAAQVILNTPALERSFRTRHPGVQRVRTIPNGFDPEAFADLPSPTGGGTPGFVEIAHFGELYALRSGKYLLQGMARLRDDAPAAFARVKLLFVGTMEEDSAFRAQARELGVDAALSMPGPLPHRATLARQRLSDVLLILGPENREPEVQVPGKLYEYFAAERPILTLSRERGAIAEMLELAGVSYERAEPDDPAAIAAALERSVRAVDGAAASTADVAAARDGVASFRYDRLTDRLVECFEAAWS